MSQEPENYANEEQTFYEEIRPEDNANDETFDEELSWPEDYNNDEETSSGELIWPDVWENIEADREREPTIPPLTAQIPIARCWKRDEMVTWLRKQEKAHKQRARARASKTTFLQMNMPKEASRCEELLIKVLGVYECVNVIISHSHIRTLRNLLSTSRAVYNASVGTINARDLTEVRTKIKRDSACKYPQLSSPMPWQGPPPRHSVVQTSTCWSCHKVVSYCDVRSTHPIVEILQKNKLS